MKSLLVSSLVLISLSGCLAQWYWPKPPTNLVPLPSVQFPSEYMQMYKAINSLHASLSETPLKPFLPSPTQMAKDALNALTTASNFQAGFDKAMAQVNAAVAEAAKQANIPLDSLGQLSNQFGGSVNQMLQSSA